MSMCVAKTSGRERGCSLLSEAGHLAVSGTKGFFARDAHSDNPYASDRGRRFHADRCQRSGELTPKSD